MAGKRKTRAGLSFGTAAALFIALIVFLASRAGNPQPSANLSAAADGQTVSAARSQTVSESSDTPEIPLKGLSVRYLDVGQGDSIFVFCDGSTMLIDAGIPEMGPRVVSYLKSLRVSRISVLVGTHPHDDHIGGMQDVLGNFSIGTLIMPKAANNTKTFEDLVDAIAAKGLKITAPVPGSTFPLGGAVCTILAPNSASYENLNDMSVVIRLSYKGKSFLFTGDASFASENDMLKKGFDLKSDVLKVGHHGSSSATGAAFLKAVSPRYAVVSVGAENTYGHPAKSTMNRLAKAGAKVFRTDQNGTVVFNYDGKDLTYATEK